MPSASSAPPAGCVWVPGADGWTLALSGHWVGAGPWPTPQAPGALAAARVVVDGSALAAWDAAGAARLWQQLSSVQRAGAVIAWRAVPEGLQAALELAGFDGGAVATSAQLGDGRSGWRAALAAALTTAAFFGQVLLALGRLARGRSDLRVGDLWRQVDQTGPLSLPIVSLTSALVGLMLAYMGGAQLSRMGASPFIADLVSVGMVREIAGLMTGVILAGRVGAAFAAQLASMQAGEEIDALRALGVNPVAYLVLPRLLGLLLVAPLLVSYAAIVGVLAGLPAAIGVYGMPAAEYLQRALAALTPTHLWIGLFKGTLYAALVALAGCREGLHAGRNAQAVGEATTRAVVKALVWIVAAACGTTVVFQSLGL